MTDRLVPAAHSCRTAVNLAEATRLGLQAAVAAFAHSKEAQEAVNLAYALGRASAGLENVLGQEYALQLRQTGNPNFKESAATTSELYELASRYNQLQEWCRAQAHVIADLEEQRDNIEAECAENDEYKDKAVELEDEVEDLEAEVQTLEEKINALENKHDAEVLALQEEMAILRAQAGIPVNPEDLPWHDGRLLVDSVAMASHGVQFEAFSDEEGWNVRPTHERDYWSPQNFSFIDKNMAVATLYALRHARIGLPEGYRSPAQKAQDAADAAKKAERKARAAARKAAKAAAEEGRQ